MMPARDTHHYLIKQALLNDGWQITDDPYVISYGERFLFIDLGATWPPPPNSGQLIGLQQGDCQIAVEIKEFRGTSVIAELEQAIGQYSLYRLLLTQVDPQRTLYLGITEIIYDEVFREPIGELVLHELPMNLLIIHSKTTEVQKWIPQPPTVKR